MKKFDQYEIMAFIALCLMLGTPIIGAIFSPLAGYGACITGFFLTLFVIREG